MRVSRVNICFWAFRKQSRKRHLCARTISTDAHACMHACAHAHASQAVFKTRVMLFAMHTHAQNKHHLYFHEQARTHTYTHTYTCAAVYAWADTHIAHRTYNTCKSTPALKHNSNTFKHTIVHIQPHTHDFAQPYAQGTLHHARTRTYTYAMHTRAGNGGHHPCYHA